MQETYSIGGRDFPTAGKVKVISNDGEFIGEIPIVDIPQQSDYQWQLDCLNDRLKCPEVYARFENVKETISYLRRWLAEHEKE